MSTSAPKAALENALASLPSELRKRVIKAYAELKMQSLEGQFDSIGTRAGRLAEVLLRVLQHILTGTFTPLSQQLSNFKAECERLEKLPSSAGPDGLRILMPRALSFLYTIRNKRDCGHVGGEVDANKIDAATSVRLADWCVCELVRVCHRLPIEEAQNLCDALATRRLPVIWSVLGKKRVLNNSLSYSDQVLLLLYSELELGVPIEDLFDWTEHPHSSNFRRDVISRLHSARQIEWDRETGMALISPLGVENVETNLAPRLQR